MRLSEQCESLGMPLHRLELPERQKAGKSEVNTIEDQSLQR